MDDPGIAEKLVDALVLPDGSPDLRPVHAFGIGATGYFEASDVARDFCVAEHFQGKRIRVTVRFSNGSGSAVEHDGWSDVRGMATRFHLADGAATDLIAMTLAEFFTPTPETFLSFTKAARPAPVTRESAWQKIFDMLRLTLPLPDPPPGQTTSPNAGAIQFADQNGYAQLAVFQAAEIGAPVSYVRATYHAVHTFVVVAPDGARRWVRFSWQPVEGVLNTDPNATPVDKYLQQELRDRLTEGPARFTLMMSIGEAGDDLSDPSRPVSSVPSTTMRPCWCLSSPLTQRIKVDLPDPEGPHTTTRSPSEIVMVTSRSTCSAPNHLFTFSIEIAIFLASLWVGISRAAS